MSPNDGRVQLTMTIEAAEALSEAISEAVTGWEADNSGSFDDALDSVTSIQFRLGRLIRAAKRRQ